MKIFEKTYDGESIVDINRDVSEALQDDFNPLMENIPSDDHGFAFGNFKVTIEWSPTEEFENEEIISGKNIVLPKSKEHAETMLRVAFFYLDQNYPKENEK